MPAPLPVPKFGDPVLDASGKNVGSAAFDPNTGQPLSQSGASGSSDFMDALQKQILGQAGMVSSYNSTLQDSITSLQDSGSKSDLATNMKFDRLRKDALGVAQDTSIDDRASGAGGVMNLAALNVLTKNTDKQLSDLESQRQEALLNNDAATAKNISDMKLKALEFNQKANQDVFSNLLNLGQFGVQKQQEERAQAAANDTHTKSLVEMIQDNPQAGITMDDTIESAAAKIGKNPNSPDVQLKKAQIAKAYYDMKHGGSGTAAERASGAVAKYSGYFVQGAKMKDGTPILDGNGFITPKAFKAAIKDAPTEGLTRKDFITEFGNQLYGAGKDSTDYSAYGLTPQEIKLITG